MNAIMSQYHHDKENRCNVESDNESQYSKRSSKSRKSNSSRNKSRDMSSTSSTVFDLQLKAALKENHKTLVAEEIPDVKSSAIVDEVDSESVLLSSLADTIPTVDIPLKRKKTRRSSSRADKSKGFVSRNHPTNGVVLSIEEEIEEDNSNSYSSLHPKALQELKKDAKYIPTSYSNCSIANNNVHDSNLHDGATKKHIILSKLSSSITVSISICIAIANVYVYMMYDI